MGSQTAPLGKAWQDRGSAAVWGPERKCHVCKWFGRASSLWVPSLLWVQPCGSSFLLPAGLAFFRHLQSLPRYIIKLQEKRTVVLKSLEKLGLRKERKHGSELGERASGWIRDSLTFCVLLNR